MHLLSPPGIDALKRIARDNTLLAFDFDGTLAPIVAEPDSARMSAATAHVLSMLCQRTTVAVISGRGAADVRSRVPAGVRYVLGNQGIDGWSDSAVDLEPLRHLCAAWESQLEGALAETELLGRGVAIENKGVTLAAHYRLARNRDDTALRLRAVVDALQPSPRVLEGKFVYDLLPPGAIDKRAALERLSALEHATGVLYIGDDDPDEVIFRSAPENWLTVRVGYARDSAARFHLAGPTEVTALLHRLLRVYDQQLAA